MPATRKRAYLVTQVDDQDPGWRHRRQTILFQDFFVPLFLQQSGYALAQFIRCNFRNVSQVIPNRGGHFKCIFKSKAGIQQATGQDSPKKRDPLIFSFIDDNGFQFLSLGRNTTPGVVNPEQYIELSVFYDD